jgi:hypothetical protein
MPWLRRSMAHASLRGRGSHDGRSVVGLASCVRLPKADADEALIVAALGAAGISAQVMGWDDPCPAVGAKV